MNGFWYGFIAAFSFGTADFLAGRSSRRLGSLLTLLYMQMVGFVLLGGWMLIDQQWVGMIQQPMAVLWAILFMGFDILGILCLYQALAKGKVSIVTPIASSFSAVTVVLAILFGERLSWMVLVGIMITIIGVVIASNQPPSIKDRGKAKGIFWAVMASLLLGTAFFGIRFPTEELGAFTTVWIGRLQAVVMLPLFIFFFLRKKWMANKKRWIPNWGEGGWIFLIGILDAVAFISYNMGLTVSETSLVVTLTSLFAVFTIFWGIVIFKEKITRFQWAGLLCIFSGLVLISV